MLLDLWQAYTEDLSQNTGTPHGAERIRCQLLACGPQSGKIHLLTPSQFRENIEGYPLQKDGVTTASAFQQGGMRADRDADGTRAERNSI